MRRIKTRVQPCSANVDPAVKAFASRLENELVDFTHKAVKRSRTWTQLRAGPPTYFSCALKWIRANGYQAAISDKDGVFCLLSREVAKELLHAQLNSRWYRHMSPFTLKNEMQLAISGTYKLAKRLDDLELKHLGQEVRKGLRGAELKSIVSKMSYTVKTHKPVGKIACRIIHSAAGSSFRGLSLALNILF